MKINSNNSRQRDSARRPAAAFTIVETMIVMTLYSLLVVVLVSSQLFGMRLQRICETKLAATSAGRKALNQVCTEIQTGKILLVGSGDASSFTNTPDNSPQIGNALQICATTNTGVFVRYYLDADDNSLKRVTSLGAEPQILAGFVTNRSVFQAEDFRGNVLTNQQNNRVIRMQLEFYRWEYPIATVGNGGMYDYYRLQTRVTRRLIE